MNNRLWPDHYRFADSIGPNGVTVHCERYVVIGETARCYYVVPENMASLTSGTDMWSKQAVARNRKRVLKDSKKRFCYPDIADAMQSYRKRKYQQIRHAKIAISAGEAAYAKAKELCGDSRVKPSDFPVLCDGADYIKSLSWGDC